MRNYITIDQIVRDVINDNELDLRAYERILGIAVRGYKFIYTRALPGRVTQLIPIHASRKIAMLPRDYVTYYKVGVVFKDNNGNDIIYTLSLNKDLLSPDEAVYTHCDCPESDSVSSNVGTLQSGYTIGDVIYEYANAYRGTTPVSYPIYGYGGGESAAGSFKIDEENGWIVLGSDVPTDYTEIALEYKSNGIKGKETRIPDVAHECLIDWVKWKMLNTKNSSATDRREARLDFADSLAEVQAYTKPLRIDEILDIFYANSTLTS